MRITLYALLLTALIGGNVSYGIDRIDPQVSVPLPADGERLVELLWERVTFITTQLIPSSEQDQQISVTYRSLNTEALQKGEQALRIAWKGLLVLAQSEKRSRSPLPPLCLQEAWHGLLEKIKKDIQELVAAVVQEETSWPEWRPLLQHSSPLAALQEDEILQIVVDEVLCPAARDVQECIDQSNGLESSDSASGGTPSTETSFDSE